MRLSHAYATGVKAAMDCFNLPDTLQAKLGSPLKSPATPAGLGTASPQAAAPTAPRQPLRTQLPTAPLAPKAETAGIL